MTTSQMKGTPVNKCLSILFVALFVTFGCDFPSSRGGGYYQGQQPAYQQYDNPQPPVVTQSPPPVFYQPPQPPVVTRQQPPPPPREHTCQTCGGTGKILCPTCQGKAYLGRCAACNGTGQSWNANHTINYGCIQCNGTGRQKCTTCLYINVPQGTIQCQRCTGTGKVTQ